MKRWVLLAAGVSLALGCGSSSSPADVVSGDGGGSEAGAEAGGGDDAGDVLATDATVPGDGAAEDAAQDGGAPTDAGGGGDGGGNTLAGTWRLVQFESTTAQGTTVFTDTNTQVPNTTFFARFNGYLSLTADRLAFSVGLLINDHFAIDATKPPANAFPAYGATAPGTLNGDTFQIAGGSTGISWTRNADGSITQVDTGTPGQTNRITWARIDSPQGAADFGTATGLAVLLNDTTAGADAGTPPPPNNPRVALAWDLPGGAGVMTTNDTALSFVGPNSAYALFNAAVTDAPAAAQALVGDASIAIAYVIVYSDENDNLAFDPEGTADGGSADVIRGISPVAIAVRNGASSTAFQSSVFRDLYPGFQFVHLHLDYVAGQIGLEPFDPTHPVSPDVPVEPGPVGIPIPNLL